ncbi:hypothetical protein TSUD_203640 [Trifolium subterraneum]|uniref:DUF4408 domain-containing protein n=1 Tax=Trifolium subterraneum TaxID=3900 RepID=A0A2Z6M3R7_TRISU|nr:hypothetical protein TSUD_203640 [Trifolium subterraneum]
MQLIFSVSIFALFVFYSCGFCYVYPLDQLLLNAYFSTTWLLSMLALTLERKYMFLICNILIAFLAKTSSTSSHGLEYSQYSQPSIFNKEEHDEEVAVQVMKKNDDNDDDDEEEEEDDDIDELVTTMVSAKEEEELGDINTEELNRKFDEFIRKMKEEIRIQPQTLHPIMYS